MGTKNDTGAYDCYRSAEPDEPMFVLLGRDSTASVVVMFWRALKQIMVQKGTSQSSKAKLDEARDCAHALEAWAKMLGKNTQHVFDAMKIVMPRGADGLLMDDKARVLAQLNHVAELLTDEMVEELVKKQKQTEPGTVETDIVCSMLYAAAEVFNARKGV